jgi:hypothetical protein
MSKADSMRPALSIKTTIRRSPERRAGAESSLLALDACSSHLPETIVCGTSARAAL